MSLGSGILPIWMLTAPLSTNFELYEKGEITAQEMYNRIKDDEYIPESVKSNWKKKASHEKSKTPVAQLDMA